MRLSGRLRRSAWLQKRVQYTGVRYTLEVKYIILQLRVGTTLYLHACEKTLCEKAVNTFFSGLSEFLCARLGSSAL